MEDLILKLKKEIIEQLNFDDLNVDDIDENLPLFGPEGLGLDSIDALELLLIFEKNYGLKINDIKDGKAILYSVKTMADYIVLNKKDK